MGPGVGPGVGVGVVHVAGPEGLDLCRVGVGVGWALNTHAPPTARAKSH